MNIIETVDLTKKYNSFTANNKINLSVREHEIKCIVGENGAGKTTLMNMLYGVFKPTSGYIKIRGEIADFDNPAAAIARGIGMVHQQFKLVPSLTVYENVLLGVEMQKTLKSGRKTPFLDKKKELAAVTQLIGKYHFDLNAEDKVEDLSVGCRQRVEILKMLYRNIDILILDEPTAVLTPQETDNLIAILKNLQTQGKTIIVITHKLREVLAISDSVTVIKQGKITGNVLTQNTNEQELAQMMVGRDVVLSVSNNKTTAPSDEELYVVKNLSTINSYGKEVVSDVSFIVHKREILGIAGVEGNGQTELVNLLAGIMTSTKGSVQLLGKDVTDKWPDELRRSGLGIIPEDRYSEGLCLNMTVADNCIAGYHGNRDVCHHGILLRKQIASKRDRLIKQYDIRITDKNGYVSQLSGGNAQKIIIAREMDQNPMVLLACQPTRGIDVGSIEFIHKQLLKYREDGHAIILVSSELTEILSLSDRIIVMYKGRIVGEVSPQQATAEKIGLLMAGINEEANHA